MRIPSLQTLRRRRLLALSLAVPLTLSGACRPLTAGAPLPLAATASTPGVSGDRQYPAASGGPTGFGLLTVIPDSTGSTSSPEALRASAPLGVRYLRVNLDWAVSEPQPGGLTFTTDNDRRIQSIEQSGLRLFPTLYVGRGWMNGAPAENRDQGSRSYPPTDLGTEWSDEYGFSRGYFDFVTMFFTHYRGHFDYVAIENEANSARFWGGTAEEYVRLIRTAYKAIKAADPDVVVVDSGFVSNLWGLCIADDDLQSALKSRDEVVQFAIDYYRAETARIQIRSEADLMRMLAEDSVQEQCRRARYILQGMAGSVDAISFHFYEDYRVMPFVVDWIRYRTQLAGYAPSVITNEMGQRGPDVAFAETEAHAESVFKKLVTARALGAQVVVWFSADTIGKPVPSPDKVGLFAPGGEMRPAAETFRVVSESLGPELRLWAAPATGPGLFHYVFGDATGQPAVEALWLEGGRQSVVLRVPPGRTNAVEVDFLGRTHALNPTDGAVSVEAGDGPLFIIWS
jgi:hypothetical protein